MNGCQQILLNNLGIKTIGHITDGCHGLQLSCTLVDACNACVAINTLASIFQHETTTTVNLNTVVGVLVGILGVHALGQRCEGIGQTLILLQFLAFLCSKFALACNIFQCFVNVHITGCLVKQGTSGIQLGLDIRNHFGHSGEFNNGLTELLTVASIGNGFVIGCLAQPHALGCDAKACAVHQRHHIFDKSKLAVTAQLTLGVLIYKLAGRRTVDTHFILNSTYVHTAVFLVIDEHGQSTSVLCASFASCQYKMNVAVSIGDEAL